jgi:16S rRNA (adenine1518-N6/adenine1519-N6)-dimethyltransferase
MYKKKSLGQHFLKSASYVQAIVDAANVQSDEHILEIGPGDGVLTKELLARGAAVTAVEKDHRLISILEETFAKEIKTKQLRVIEGDALDIDQKKIKLKDGEYKLVANIPYYITGALLRKFLSEKQQPSTIVFLVQKEVAERIAKSKKESLLSLSIKAYGTPNYIKTVPRGAFSPAPDVDSAILLIKNISRDNFKTAAHEKLFFELIHAGFAQKRKIMKKNIEKALGEKTAQAMQEANIPANARAEDVALPQWLVLAAK